jgi:hypothetical protein
VDLVIVAAGSVMCVLWCELLKLVRQKAGGGAALRTAS